MVKTQKYRTIFGVHVFGVLLKAILKRLIQMYDFR